MAQTPDLPLYGLCCLPVHGRYFGQLTYLDRAGFRKSGQLTLMIDKM
jgi:hypothetical protein